MAWLRLSLLHAIYVFVAILLGYLAVASQISSSFRVDNPSLGVAWATWDARARSNLAWIETETGTTTSRQLARLHAVRALRRDGSDVTALRVMGYTTENPSIAERWFQLADAQSRRDFPTQLWLLESAVQRNQIPEAIRRYDIGLRTSALAPPLLLPVLAKAVDTDEIANALYDRLRVWPMWSVWFFREASKSASSDRNLASLGILAGKAPRPDQLEVISGLIRRFIDNGEYALARRVYAANTLKSPNKGIVQDPTFAREPLFPPFDWSMAAEGSLDTSTYAASDTANYMTLRNVDGRGGEAMAQIIMLPALVANLRLVIDAVEGENSAVGSVICLDRPSAPRVIVKIDPSRSKHWQEQFADHGCRFARIALNLDPGAPGSSLTLARFDVEAIP